MRLVYILIILHTRENGGACRVVTKGGPACLQVNLVGPHPILRHFLDRMTFSRIVNSCLAPARESLLDHATTLSLLLQNILLSPAPLYRIAEWVAPVRADVLGLSEVQKLSLNDDRIARSLEALTSFRANSLFFRLALHVIREFEIDTGRIHHDTTTVTVSGQYKTSLQEPQITYGISKAHRPDLKQLVFGLNISADGAVPISHDVFSGNRTDDTIHVGNVERLRHILGRDDFIYVADSKLATRKNMGHIDGYGGKFVTVLPRTRTEDSVFRDQLRRGEGPIRWRKLLEIPNPRRHGEADIYWSTSGGVQTTEEGYRLVWYRSSQKMRLDHQIRETSLKKAEALLFDLNRRLGRGKLRRRKAIRREIKSILMEKDCEGFLRVTIVSRFERKKKRRHCGRPGKNDPVRWVTTTHYDLDIKRDQDALKGERRTDGVFPLTTNLGETHVRKDVLLIYKYQPYVEKRHALFKTELGVAPVYLKKPRRVAGLIHAHFLAMTLDALIERTLRQGMKQMGLDSLPILPEGRETKTPTTARLLEMFSGVSWHEFKRGEETVVFPIRLSPLQKQLMRLLGMDGASYA